MKNLMNLGVSFIYGIVSILLFTFLLSILNYINFIHDGMFSFFMIFNLIVSMFIGGFMSGKKALRKGWLEGLKFGLLFIIFIFLINILGFETKLRAKFVLFNVIIIVSSIFGGMVGIGFKKEKK